MPARAFLLFGRYEFPGAGQLLTLISMPARAFLLFGRVFAIAGPMRVKKDFNAREGIFAFRTQETARR